MRGLSFVKRLEGGYVADSAGVGQDVHILYVNVGGGILIGFKETDLLTYRDNKGLLKRIPISKLIEELESAPTPQIYGGGGLMFNSSKPFPQAYCNIVVNGKRMVAKDYDLLDKYGS